MRTESGFAASVKCWTVIFFVFEFEPVKYAGEVLAIIDRTKIGRKVLWLIRIESCFAPGVKLPLLMPSVCKCTIVNMQVLFKQTGEELERAHADLTSTELNACF